MGMFDYLIPEGEKGKDFHQNMFAYLESPKLLEAPVEAQAAPTKAPSLWEQLKAGWKESPIPNFFQAHPAEGDPDVVAAQAGRTWQPRFDGDMGDGLPIASLLGGITPQPQYYKPTMTFQPPKPDPNLDLVLQQVAAPLRTVNEFARGATSPEGAAMIAPFLVPEVGVPLKLAQLAQWARLAIISKMAADAPKNIMTRFEAAQQDPSEIAPAIWGSALDVALPAAGVKTLMPKAPSYVAQPGVPVQPEVLSWQKIRARKKRTPPPEEAAPPVEPTAPVEPPPAPIFQKPTLQPEVPQDVKFAMGIDPGVLKDTERYKELTRAIGAMGPEERAKAFAEIEQIKNRNAGMPPVGDISAKPELPPIEDELTPKSRLVLRDPKQLKLTPDKEGKYDSGQLIGRMLRDVSESERNFLDEAEIRKDFPLGSRVTLAEMDKWLEESGPRVEIHKGTLEPTKGATKNTPEMEENMRLVHELDTELPGWRRMASNEVPKEFQEKYNRQYQLSQIVEEQLKNAVTEGRASRTGGASYSRVSPKREDQMPGYTEISVVTGRPRTRMDRIRAKNQKVNVSDLIEEPQFKTRHRGIPDNTLGWSRGYMETRPGGGKTYHVVELQSDWLNAIREAEGEHAKGDISLTELQDVIDKLDHPLLPEADRMVLKATIDHAKKEGATHISISDAETAMMTEGLDVVAKNVKPVTTLEVAKNRLGFTNVKDLEAPGLQKQIDREMAQHFGKDWREGQYVEFGRQGIFRVDRPEANLSFRGPSDLSRVETARHLQPYAKEPGRYIPQEKGMRHHYEGGFRILDKEGNPLAPEKFPSAEDAHAFAKNRTAGLGLKPGEYEVATGAAQRMAHELTGKEGVKVDYGEHKMATEFRQGAPIGEGRVPRKDLLFKEPSGEFKTTATAREYSLEKTPEGPYSMSGTRLRMGILDPQLIRDVMRDFRRAIAGVESDIRTIRTAGGTHESKMEVLRKRDASEVQSYIHSERIGKNVEKLAEKLFGEKQKQSALNAIPAVYEAGGNIRKLADFERRAAKSPEALRSIEFARNNWKHMQTVVKAVKAFDRSVVATAKRVGVKVSPIKDLIASSYEYSDRGILFGKRQEMGITAPPKSYKTVFHAIEAGHDPLTFDGARLLTRRASEILGEVNKRFWTESLKTMKDPTGTRIYREVKRGTSIPDGYEKVIGLPGVVLKPYISMFDAITSSSRISGSHLGKAALEVQGAVKHSLLAIDTFHLGRISFFRRSLGLGGGGFWGHKLGLSVLEYSKADLAEAVRMGLAPKDAVTYAETQHTLPQGTFTNRQILNDFIADGLNVAKHGENLYNAFVRNFPGIKQTVGAFNKFIFDKVSRGAMAESAVIEFHRLAKERPNATAKEIRTAVLRDINFRFGNIGRQGLIKSRQMQDLAQLTFLAPKWVESMVQSEVRSAGQLAKAANPLSENFGSRGTLARSTGNLLLTYVAITQAINYASTGHFTWDNEEGHRMDAWIPPLPESLSKSFGITTPNKGFWFNPLSTMAEISHDVIRYMEQGKDITEVGAQILSNKLSTFSRGLSTLITGRTWDGVKTDGAWDRVLKSVVAYLDPRPLPLRQAQAAYQQGEIAPFERQAIGMSGIKIEPESTQSQMARLTKGMSVKERMLREQQIKTEREKANPRSEMMKIASAERAMTGNMERGREVTKAQSKADQQWMESRGLKVPGFSDTLREGDYTIHTSKTESEEFKHDVIKEVADGIKSLRSKPGFEKLSSDKQQEYFNAYMRARIRKAENDAKKRIQSLSKTEKH